MNGRGTIIIPQHGLTELTLNCIRSLRGNESEHWPIIVISDGCPDEERDRLNEGLRKDDLTTILNRSRCGVTASWNAGVECAETEYVVLLNNDTLSHGPWVNTFLSPLKQAHAWIAGPRMRTEASLKVPQRGGTSLQVLEGWCLGFAKKSWEELGGFDSSFTTYWSDTDFQLRGAMACGGWNSLERGVVANLPLRHLGHRTTHQSDLRDESKGHWQEDRRKFRRKWRQILRNLAPSGE